jgi:hypothetical protein
MWTCAGNGKTTTWALNGISFRSTTMLIRSCCFHRQHSTAGSLFGDSSKTPR